MQAKEKTNKQFMVLSVIGILIVVICHLARNIYSYINMLPYIAIFVFVSGYFYKEQNEEKPYAYLFYKFKKLMIPFFMINLIYGIIVNLLKNLGIVRYGEGINLFTLFIQPFINNNQFVFNFPAWFVPTLFLTYVCYVVIQRLYKKAKLQNEIMLFIIFIALQIISVYNQSLIYKNAYWTILFRVLFFLPFFQFGYLYKQKWQKYDDKIPTIPYLIVLFGINYAFYKAFGDLNYDMHEFSGFKSTWIFIPTITTFIGILFYTRIARVLSKWIGNNRLVNYISNNTFSIMTHHLFVAFLVGLVLYKINVPYFDVESFKNGWVYVYEIPNWELLIQTGYVILGICIPLLIHYTYQKIISKIYLLHRTTYTKNIS